MNLRNQRRRRRALPHFLDNGAFRFSLVPNERGPVSHRALKNVLIEGRGAARRLDVQVEADGSKQTCLMKAPKSTPASEILSSGHSPYADRTDLGAPAAAKDQQTFVGRRGS